MKKYKAHPFMMLKIIKPLFFVLLLPAARKIISSVTNKRYGFMPVIEVAVLAAVIVFAVIGWKSCEISIEESLLTLKSGVLKKSKTQIGIKRISGVTVSENPVYWLFGAKAVRIETETGYDFAVVLSKRDAEEVLLLLGFPNNTKYKRVGIKREIFFAAATSSAAVGLLLAAPVVNRAGKLLNIAITETLIDTVTQTAQRLSNYISPAAGVLSLVLIVLYVISFFSNLSKIIFMTLCVTKDKICVRSGVLPRKSIAVKAALLNTVSAESPPIMRLFGLGQITAGVARYGKSRVEKLVLLPIASKKRQEKILTPAFDESKILSSPRAERFRFVRWYLLSLIIAVLVFLIAFSVTDFFYDVLLLAFFVVAAVLLYLIDLAVYNHKNGGIVFSKNGITTFFARRLTFKRVLFMREKVGMLRIRRFPADKRKGTCSVKVYAKGLGGESAKVKFIPYNVLCAYYKTFWKN